MHSETGESPPKQQQVCPTGLKCSKAQALGAVKMKNEVSNDCSLGSHFTGRDEEKHPEI